MTERRTLVVHTGAIGDLILAGRAFTWLRMKGPVDAAGRRDRLTLMQGAGVVDDVYELEQTGFESVFTKPNETLRRFLARYDTAIVWMRDDGTIREAFRECGVNRIETYSGLPPADWHKHASDYYLTCIGAPDAPEFEMNVAPASLRSDVIIHPGSGSAAKNWPMESFAQLGERLTREGLVVRWSCGPAEETLAYPADAVLVPAAPLNEIAAYIAASQCYIGNDSGITHLAAAVGCRTFALFGSTDPNVWSPRGPDPRRVHMLTSFDVDTLFELVTRSLKDS